ncbi:MAG TPA: DUF488 domain-containing protein [Mesorhizobium sp.]|jgi:uncharacterized protein YeaO (DUF488 family)|uniref:DUF488 domain-containing protein n=1 Tax=Mesorhizobium sp. TaxID=1871066 RepID=UPI002DDCAFFB|nr:DUF488 domain-containing protein [Mesorhizobium sp.]HEV2507303.1 DUF488 domain-containing protein [Mesorhizobium sp.]
MAFNIVVKRIYEPAAASDGQRVLVDRVWPRGMTKEKAALTLWLKDIAPSDVLRKWFDHQPERWEEFQRRYESELAGRQEPLRELASLLEHGRVTLLYGAHEERYNNAVALADYLQKQA